MISIKDLSIRANYIFLLSFQLHERDLNALMQKILSLIVYDVYAHILHTFNIIMWEPQAVDEPTL